MPQHQILLYYKYVQLAEPEKILFWQRELCQRLNLKGRIIISREGINGTVEGITENTEIYIKEILSHKTFSSIDFKKSQGTGDAFPKLSIRIRNEIVTLGMPDTFPVAGKNGGKYISAGELHEWYENKEDFVVLDLRNIYECFLGKFDQSVSLPIRYFREIPKYSEELKYLKGKKVVAVCTGGVRCEKGTAYLKEKVGIENIYQLHNGIDSYIKKFPKGRFRGDLYVFDGRGIMSIDNKKGH